MTHDNTNTQTFRKTSTYAMVVTALMAAVTCILAPLSVPIGPVPISLTNLAIYLSLYLLDWKKGTLSYLIYLLLGLVGLPVFSGFTGGLAKLAGPTGGYIIGFIPMAIIAGIVIDKFSQRWIQILGMIVGTAICYCRRVRKWEKCNYEVGHGTSRRKCRCAGRSSGTAAEGSAVHV